jgi:hypothetical protein
MSYLPCYTYSSKPGVQSTQLPGGGFFSSAGCMVGDGENAVIPPCYIID